MQPLVIEVNACLVHLLVSENAPLQYYTMGFRYMQASIVCVCVHKHLEQSASYVESLEDIDIRLLKRGQAVQNFCTWKGAGKQKFTPTS